MKKLRRLSSIAWTTALAIVLAGCVGSTGDGTAGSGTQAPPGSTETGEGVTVTMALPTLYTMDFAPRTSEGDNEKLLMLMGNNLIGLDPATSEFTGELAESWEMSDDGLTWTFRLRPDVQFHDGWGTVTAEDVQWSWEQWIAEDSTHHMRNVYRDVVGGSIDGFEIVSDLEFRLHADVHVPILPFVCSCNPGMTVFSKDYYEQEGEAALAHPIASGPFKFVSSTPGQELVLERHEEYWGQVAEYERLVIQEIPDGAARLAQVKAGAVDMAQLSGFLADEAEADPNLKLLGIPHVANAWLFLGGSYWGSGPSAEHLDRDAPWIQADEPEKGLAIREALSLAIDRETILDVSLKGHGSLTYGPLLQYAEVAPLTDPSWELPEYNPDLAREKLAEGGYPDGFEFTIVVYNSDFDTASMSEALAGMWEEIGLTVIREQQEENVLYQYEGTYETAGKVWVRLTGFSLDPIATVALLRDHPDLSPVISHPAFDDAYAAMVAETDLDARSALARQLIETLESEKIAPSLMAGSMLFVAGPRIADWTPIPGLNTPGNLESITLTP